MDYMNSEIALAAIRKMKDFEKSLGEVYDSFDIPFRDNLGRRNGVISYAQEQFFAREMQKSLGTKVVVSGKTGEPDIVLPDIEKEIECKLTSGSGGSWNLQTDYTTLTKKGSLDYLYVLANGDFTEFAVLFFEGLTVDDFYPPSPGAREKARMNKTVAMEKCHVLVGVVSCKNHEMIKKYADDYKLTMLSLIEKMAFIEEKEEKARTEIQKQKIEKTKEYQMNRHVKKLNKYTKKATYWLDSNKQFTIILEEV
jgi:hypothetical protein